MNRQMLRIEIKDITAEGTFEGILSQYGVLDSTGDIVEAGAFAKSIKERGSEVPLLWQHKADVPIGMLELQDTETALLVKGRLLMELPSAQTAYSCIKANIVKGLSIGFSTINKVVKDGIRHLTEIKLYEGSIVTFPALESALITAVKALQLKGDFTEELSEIQILDSRYQFMQALSSALSSVVWSDLSRDEAISTTGVILQQFVDAYTAFLPVYLDTIAEMYGGMETWAARRNEIKSGAAISAANKTLIKSALAQMLSAHESLSALISDEAGTSTSDGKAADDKPEPVVDHSAEVELMSKIGSLIPA